MFLMGARKVGERKFEGAEIERVRKFKELR